MESLMMPQKSRIRYAFQKALKSYDEHALIQWQMNTKLMSNLMRNLPHSSLDSVLELGCGSGMLSELLQEQISANYWLFNDLCDVRPQLTARLTQPFDFYCGDAEFFPFKQRFDLIASASAVQWFHHPSAFLSHCKKGLNSQGLLAIATFGENNLKEIRQITDIGLEYPNLSQWQSWLAADFELLWCENSAVQLAFDTPLDVLKHLKYTGVTATNQGIWTRTHLNQFIRDYQKAFTLESGKVRLTYHPLLFIAQFRADKSQ